MAVVPEYSIFNHYPQNQPIKSCAQVLKNLNDTKIKI